MAAPTPAPTTADDPMMIALFFTDRFGCATRSTGPVLVGGRLPGELWTLPRFNAMFGAC